MSCMLKTESPSYEGQEGVGVVVGVVEGVGVVDGVVVLGDVVRAETYEIYGLLT